jgi:hypothetical protein
VSVLPEGLVEDGLVQRFLGSAQPHAPLFDRPEVEEVGVDLVGEDRDKEATDGVEEVVVGSGLRESSRYVSDESQSAANCKEGIVVSSLISGVSRRRSSKFHVP